MANATFPFATLKVNKDSLELNFYDDHQQIYAFEYDVDCQDVSLMKHICTIH